MADKPFKIQITTEADLRGSAKVQRSLEGIEATTTKASGKAVELGKVSEAALNKGAKAGSKFQGVTRQLSNGIRGLALQFPVLGRFAEAAVNPIMAGFGALITATVLLVNHFKRLSESFKGWQSPEFKEALEKQKETLAAAALSAADYERQLTRIRLAALGATQASNELSAATLKRARQDDELQSAQLALKLAQVDDAEAAGTISGTQAITQRAGLRAEHEQQRLDRQAQTEQELIKLKEQELRQARELAELNEGMLQRERERRSGLGSEEMVTTEIASLEEQLKKLEAYFKYREKTSSFAGIYGGAVASTDTTYQDNLAAYSQAKGRLSALKGSEGQAQIARIRESEETMRGLQDAVTSLTKQAGDLSGELRVMRRSVAEDKAFRGELSSIQSQTAEVQTGTAIRRATSPATAANAEAVYQSAIANNPTLSPLKATIRESMQMGDSLTAELLQAIVDLINERFAADRIQAEYFRQQIEILRSQMRQAR